MRTWKLGVQAETELEVVTVIFGHLSVETFSRCSLVLFSEFVCIDIYGLHF